MVARVSRKHAHIGLLFMQRNVRNLLFAQIIITLAVAIAFFFTHDWRQALVAFYGGGLLMASTGLMVLKLRKVEKLDAMQFQLVMYSGFLQRLIIALSGFAIGIGWLKFAPAPMVIAFALAYLSFPIAAGRQVP